MWWLRFFRPNKLKASIALILWLLIPYPVVLMGPSCLRALTDPEIRTTSSGCPTFWKFGFTKPWFDQYQWNAYLPELEGHRAGHPPFGLGVGLSILLIFLQGKQEVLWTGMVEGMWISLVISATGAYLMSVAFDVGWEKLTKRTLQYSQSP